MTSEALIRELAAKVILRFGFSPPIDLDQLAKKAGFNVRYVEFPHIIRDCGGAIRLGDDARDVLIRVNAADPEQRQRFSLAHELGHFYIPWHAGLVGEDMIGCVPESSDSARAAAAFPDLEQEAEWFASEMLMPTDWIQHLLTQRTNNIPSVLKKLCALPVSTTAACRALHRYLPVGIRLLNYTAHSSNGPQAYYAPKTPHHLCSSDCEGWEALGTYQCKYSNNFVKCEKIGTLPTAWRNFTTSLSAKSHADPKTLLRQVLEAKGFPDTMYGHIQSSLAGIYSNNKTLTAEQLYEEFLGRFYKNDTYPELAKSKDFRSFLALKAQSFKQGK